MSMVLILASVILFEMLPFLLMKMVITGSEYIYTASRFYVFGR